MEGISLEYLGDGGRALVAEDGQAWDVVVLVRYPDRFTFMIRDRGGRFAGDFDAAPADAGIRVIKSPPRAPRANALCERTIRTLLGGVFGRILIRNETHRCGVLDEYRIAA